MRKQLFSFAQVTKLLKSIKLKGVLTPTPQPLAYDLDYTYALCVIAVYCCVMKVCCFSFVSGGNAKTWTSFPAMRPEMWYVLGRRLMTWFPASWIWWVRTLSFPHCLKESVFASCWPPHTSSVSDASRLWRRFRITDHDWRQAYSSRCGWNGGKFVSVPVDVSTMCLNVSIKWWTFLNGTLS